MSPEVNKKIHCLKFILFSLGSDIGFRMFTLRENLDGFLKEVEVGFVLYQVCVNTGQMLLLGGSGKISRGGKHR